MTNTQTDIPEFNRITLLKSLAWKFAPLGISTTQRMLVEPMIDKQFDELSASEAIQVFKEASCLLYEANGKVNDAIDSLFDKYFYIDEEQME